MKNPLVVMFRYRILYRILSSLLFVIIALFALSYFLLADFRTSSAVLCPETKSGNIASEKQQSVELEGNFRQSTYLPIVAATDANREQIQSAKEEAETRAIMCPDGGCCGSQPPPTPTPLPTPTQTPLPLNLPWKGIGVPNIYGESSDPTFWGLNPSLWYDWGGIMRSQILPNNSLRVASKTSDQATILNNIRTGLKSPNYIPMIWCTDDVSSTDEFGITGPAGISPMLAAELASQYKGRVWLIFNEPDNPSYAQCGGKIAADSRYSSFFNGTNWDGLGRYLARQYMRYYKAIKKADKDAHIFPLGLLNLPMPTLPMRSDSWTQAIPIWNSFLAELKVQGGTLDGIAIHAYPHNFSTYHENCNWGYVDYACVTRAVQDAHNFFQGIGGKNNYADMTRGKPIWITEIGTLTDSASQPWLKTRDEFQSKLLVWFQNNIRPGQSSQYINAVFWFSTHYIAANDGGDKTSSNLLDHRQFPNKQVLTPVGEAWKVATCYECER